MYERLHNTFAHVALFAESIFASSSELSKYWRLRNGNNLYTVWRMSLKKGAIVSHMKAGRACSLQKTHALASGR